MEDNQEWREAAADTVNLLLRQVRTFLARREGRYDYFYESFKLAAFERYAAGVAKESQPERTSQQWHKLLADYFRSLPTWRELSASSRVESRRDPTIRKISELPYHQTEAQQWDRLEETLCDLDFIEAKCMAGMTVGLVKDYHQALLTTEREVVWAGRNRVVGFSRFVKKDAHILAAYPELTFQQAANQPDSSPQAAAAKERLVSEGVPWIEWINKPQVYDPCLMTLVGHSDEVETCAYSPDGKRIMSASRDNTHKVWDAETGELISTSPGLSDLGSLREKSPVRSLWVKSPDGKRAVSAIDDGTLKVQNMETGEGISLMPGHTGPVTACAYSPDGKRIVSASRDKTLKVWDVEEVETSEMTSTMPGHTDPVTAFAYSPDGKRIVSASFDYTLKVWDVETGKMMATLYGHANRVGACAYSPDGRRVVSASDDGTLKIRDVETGVIIYTLSNHEGWVRVCAYSPDGKRIVSGSHDNTLKVWIAETGEMIGTLEGHSDGISACAYSPDGRRVVSASEDNTLKVWDVELCLLIGTLEGHSNFVDACAYSPDGKRIMSGSWDNTLKIWDNDTGEMIATLSGHSNWVNACAYSPDGRRIVSGSHDNTLKVWDAETGEMISTLSGNWDMNTAYPYSPDGKRIVLASPDRTLKVWDLETGAVIATFLAANNLYSGAIRANGSCVTHDIKDSVYFLKLRGINFEPPIVTLAHLYRFPDWRRSRPWTIFRWGKQDAQPTAVCEWCGQRISPPASVIDTIRSISRNAGLSADQSPCATLPAEAWDEPGLLSECPHCNQPLRFNPFIVNNRSLFRKKDSPWWRRVPGF